MYDILVSKCIDEIKSYDDKMFDAMWKKLRKERKEDVQRPINLSVDTDSIKTLIEQIEMAEELSAKDYRTFHKLD